MLTENIHETDRYFHFLLLNDWRNRQLSNNQIDWIDACETQAKQNYTFIESDICMLNSHFTMKLKTQ